MNSIKHSLRTVRKNQSQGVIGDFLSWWWLELCALRPTAWGSNPAQSSNLIFQLEDDQLVVRFQSQEGNEVLGHYSLTDESVDGEAALADKIRLLQKQQPVQQILLPSDWIAILPVTLPAAAKDNLEQVLRFEMDRQTPFKPADVYFDYSIVEQDRLQGDIQLDLAVVPRKRLEDLFSAVKRLGGTPGLMDVCTGQGDETLGYNLMPSGHGPERRPMFAGLNGILAGVALLLFIVALAIPPIQLYESRETLREQVSKARQVANKVAALRADYQAQVDSLQNLLGSGEQRPSNLQILDEVARLLPDDTWLSNLDLDPQGLKLQGESEGASRLISLIESSELFNQTTFTSPVTQNRRTGKEAFSMSTRLNHSQGQKQHD